MIEHTESDEEREMIAADLRKCLERADLLGEAMAAIYIDHAINILEAPNRDRARGK